MTIAATTYIDTGKKIKRKHKAAAVAASTPRCMGLREPLPAFLGRSFRFPSVLEAIFYFKRLILETTNSESLKHMNVLEQLGV